MTQKQQILNILKRRKKGATNGDLIRLTGSTCPHKRVEELERDGVAIERESRWHKPKGGRGAWLTVYRLA